MKTLKALLVALALSCLLATSAQAGTMTTGAGQPPPPPTTTEEDGVDAFYEPPTEDAPAAEESGLSFDVVREAMLRIALWVNW